MGKLVGFLRLCAVLSFCLFTNNLMAEGFTCNTSGYYISCKDGYYLSDCGTTYDGRTITSFTTGNSCKQCPSGYDCSGNNAVCPKALTITYKAGSYGKGTVPAATSCGKNVSCTLTSMSTTTFYRPGYKLIGWSTSSTATTATYTTTGTFSDNTTLYPVWTACGAGTYHKDGTGTAANTCTACNGASYQDQTGQTSCKLCSSLTIDPYLTSSAGVTGSGSYNYNTSSSTGNNYTSPKGCYTRLTTSGTPGTIKMNCYANANGVYGATDSYCDGVTGSVCNAGYYYDGDTSSTGGFLKLRDKVCQKVPENKYYAGGTVTSGTKHTPSTCPDPSVDTYKEKLTEMDWLSSRCPDATSSNSSIHSASYEVYNNTGLSAITQCVARYYVDTPCARFTVEVAKYNSSTGRYNTDTSSAYTSGVSAGYYLSEKYNSSYCDKGTYMLYRKAVKCPENSFCPGGNVPLCSSGTYNDTWGATSCSSISTLYHLSSGGTSATSSQSCYLKTTAGKYVPGGTVITQETCPAGKYCPGDIKVYYQVSGGGGSVSCAKNSTSNAGSDEISDCKCNAGYSGNASISDGTCTACAKGTYKGTVGNTTCTSATWGQYVDTTGATTYKLCSALDSNKTDGTYSSESPRSASTDCRFKQNQQPVPEFCTIKYSNTMSYTGSKWPDNTYIVRAKAGSIIVDNNNCSQCDAGTYSSGDTATSCTTCAAGKYSTPGSSSCTNVDAGYYNTGCGTDRHGMVCSSSYSGGFISAGYYGGAGATSSTGSGMVAPGYYTTGGGTSKTPTAYGDGCIGQGNTCGMVDAGYWTSHGGKRAQPESGDDCVNGACGVIDAGYYSTGGATRSNPYDPTQHCRSGNCGSVAGGYFSTGGATKKEPTSSDCVEGNSCGLLALGVYSTCGATVQAASSVDGYIKCLSDCECGVVGPGYYITGGGTSATPTANGNGCVGTGSTCGPMSAGYYSRGGAGRPNATNYWCWGYNTHDDGRGGCGKVDAGYYSTGGGTDYDGKCIDGKDCGMIAAGYYGGAGATSSSGTGEIAGGYYSTGGGTSATPTANGNGCVGSGNTCGKIAAGHWSWKGGKKASPTSSSDCTTGACGVIRAGYYSTCGGIDEYATASSVGACLEGCECGECGTSNYCPTGSGTPIACPNNLTTCGKGKCADESSDCGRNLNIEVNGKKQTFYLRSERRTNPSLNFIVDDIHLFGDLLENTNKKTGGFHVTKGTTEYLLISE